MSRHDHFSSDGNHEEPKYKECPDCKGESVNHLRSDVCSCHINPPCSRCECSCETCNNTGEVESEPEEEAFEDELRRDEEAENNNED